MTGRLPSAAMAEAIGELAGNRTLRQSLVDAGNEFLEKMNPAARTNALLAIADSLMTDDFRGC